ncbi:MAG: toprim domain-containing protein, partial [Alphaproteobacteria bacterium]|nr:toprim domain-containing protein [Alphaproteobacteria bacterium]
IDFATSEKGGDFISLYAYIKGLTQGEAVRCLAGNFDIQNFSKFEGSTTKASKVPKVNFPLVTKIWKECLNPQGTLVESYLRMRGCMCDIPQTLKIHPKLYHKDTKSYHPAMVAAVQVWPVREIIGIHRTYLNHDGSGKADIISNKMMLGVTKGGAVRLTEPGKTLILAEGIETALSVHLATEMPTWAALSTSGLRNIKLPTLDVTSEIIIAADNDSAGLNAANLLKNGLLKEGYTVRIALPDKGSDFNDMLRE